DSIAVRERPSGSRRWYLAVWQAFVYRRVAEGKMRPGQLAAAVVCLIAGVVPATVGAQPQGGDTIPRELFSGLYGSFGGPMQVLTGELPGNFPPELIPEHSRVVGGLVGITTVAIFAVPDPVGAASAVERQAERTGWTVRPYQVDGFLPAQPF